MSPEGVGPDSPILLGRYRAVLCDLDGCLISGATVLPGAAGLIASLGPRLHVLSNNSTDTADSLAARLAGMDLDMAPERIHLAGVAAVERIAAVDPAARVFICGSGAIIDLAARRGLRLVTERPDWVLLTRDTAFSYARLERIVRVVRQGARLVVANPDLSHPGADGVPVPETGALLAAIAAVLPAVEVEHVGKPAPGLFEAVLNAAGVPADQAVMIGDNPETDIKGARAAGIDCLLIGDAPGARYRSLGSLAADPSLYAVPG